jgi:DNA-binding transcriptional MerR regulator
VRHYRRLGLVDEPARGASGCRRYASAELLRLAQLSTLAEAPLSEIRALPCADPQTLGADVADVKKLVLA